MAWTAELISKTKSEGNIHPVVKFTHTSTGETFERDFIAQDITNERLAILVKKVIDGLETRDTNFDALTLGEITPVAETKTLADTFFEKKGIYERKKLANTQGLTNEDLTTLVNELKTLFKAEYLNDFRWK